MSFCARFHPMASSSRLAWYEAHLLHLALDLPMRFSHHHIGPGLSACGGAAPDPHNRSTGALQNLLNWSAALSAGPFQPIRVSEQPCLKLAAFQGQVAFNEVLQPNVAEARRMARVLPELVMRFSEEGSYQ